MGQHAVRQREVRNRILGRNGTLAFMADPRPWMFQRPGMANDQLTEAAFEAALKEKDVSLLPDGLP